MKSLALILSAASAVAAPALALAQAAGNDTDVTCHWVQMTNSMQCDVRLKWANARSAMAEASPANFTERLKVEARESADRYVKKGRCDRARKRATAAGDPAFAEEIERRCAGGPAPQ